MNISTALSIQPGSSPLLTGAAPVTGDAAAFAALIGGGLLRPVPILAAADPAASRGQAGAVIGNPLPFGAPEMSPDILVAQPAAAVPAVGLTGALPTTGLFGDAAPLTEPDRASDILVDPGMPASAGDRSPVTDDALSLRGPGARFRFAKTVTTPVVSDGTMPITSPGKPAVPVTPVSTQALPTAERGHDPMSSVPADRPAPLAEADRAPNLMVEPSAPATAAPVGDRAGVLDEPAASDPGGAAGAAGPLTMPDMAPDILVARGILVAAAPVGDQGRPRDEPAGARIPATRIRFTQAKTPLGVRTPAMTGRSPGEAPSRAASMTANGVLAATPERDAVTSVPITGPTAPLAAAPLVVEAVPAAARPVVAAVSAPLEPVPEGALSPRHERSTDPVAGPLAAAPRTPPAGPSLDMPGSTDADPAPVIPLTRPTVTTAMPSRADDDMAATARPDRVASPERQGRLETGGGAPLAAAAVTPLTVVPSLALVSAGAIAPAGELFAAAIHAAGRPRTDPAGEQASSPVPMLAGAPVAAPVATGGNADPTLDLAHPGWPGAMIEHIERLRDAADAVDTRIRLVPGALGGIDVSLRRHDDAVSVTLAADRPATQAILAEARPQLHAMAEARGIRLADAAPTTSAGGGFASGAGGDPSSAHDRPRPAAFIPAAPARATTADTLDPADGRVA